MNKLELFRQKRAEMDAVYATVAEAMGRLRVGPSNNEGIYITAEVFQEGSAKKEVSIPHVTKAEAEFIVRMLTDIYEL